MRGADRARDAAVSDNMGVIRGGGNVCRDLGNPEADREELRTLREARIIGVLGLVRAAQESTVYGEYYSPERHCTSAFGLL